MVQNDNQRRFRILLLNLTTSLIISLIIIIYLGPLFLFPIILFEGVFLFLWWRKGEERFQILIWELQGFLFFLYFLILRFNKTFNVEKVALSAYLFIILGLVAIQVIISIYILFQERAVKGILFMLSSSTAVIVLIILVFIINEAAPAFVENNPVNFLTGSSWQTNYYPESYNRLTLSAHLQDYKFNMTSEEGLIYIPPNSNSTSLVRVMNEGGKADTILISVSSSNVLIQPFLNVTSVKLDPYQGAILSLTIVTTELCNVTLTLHGHSENGSQDRYVQVLARVSDNGIGFIPGFLSVQSFGEVINFKIPMTIKNTGLISDNFTLSVLSPPYFSSTLQGDNLTWDYLAMKGQLWLGPGESANFTLYPVLTSRIPGNYLLIVNAVSVLEPKINNSAIVQYSYSLNSKITCPMPSQPVALGQPAQFNVTLDSNNPGLVGLRIGGVVNGWNIILSEGNNTLLMGNGLTNITIANFTNGSAGIRHLLVTATYTDSSAPTNLTFYLDAIDWGTKPSFGILPFIVGTIVTTGLAVMIALPLGLGCSIFLSEYCPQRIRRVLRPMLELLAGIPSIIYGLWGFLVLAPFLASTIYPLFGGDSSSGKSLLTASIVLSIMIIPLIITISEDSLRVVQRELKEASYGLGATKWQTIRRVAIPSAKSGISTSVILATGRAIGETMAVLMIVGVVFGMPSSLFDGTGTMTSVIAATLPYSFDLPLTRHAIFAIALVLFIMVFILNLIIFRIQRDPDSLTKAQKPPGKWTKSLDHTTHRMNDLKRRIRLPALRKNIESDIKDQRSTSSQMNEPLAFDKNLPKWQVRRERVILLSLIGCIVLVAGFLLLIIGDIIIKGGAAISWGFITQAESGIGEQGGFANAIIGSLLLVGLAIAFAIPLAVGSALYVNEYAKRNNPIIKAILFSSNTLASTPSIVFGAFGFLFFVLFLGFKFSLIAGVLTLTIMVLPLMLASSIEALKSVPDDYREASTALGASKWMSIRSVVLPTAFPMISTGVIISIGRAIGETAAILLTAGYSALIVNSIFSPTASMPNLIYKNFEFSLKYPILGEKVYSAAFILILIVLGLNLLARFISSRSANR